MFRNTPTTATGSLISPGGATFETENQYKHHVIPYVTPCCFVGRLDRRRHITAELTKDAVKIRTKFKALFS